MKKKFAKFFSAQTKTANGQLALSVQAVLLSSDDYPARIVGGSYS